jgi:microcystin-dependent protein
MNAMKVSRKTKTTLGAVALAVGALALPSKAMACSPDPYLGGMCAFGGNFAIRGWATTEGQLLSISSNTALFSILGTTYGGDGRTSFGLPDLRGRSAIGIGRGAGLADYRLGQRGGAETQTLNLLNLPVHNHGATTSVVNTVDTSDSTIVLRALAARAGTNDPTGAVLADSPNRENIYNTGAPNVDMSSDAIDHSIVVGVDSVATTTVGNAGSSQAFNIRGPYLAVTWLIALQGVFPSRS